MHSLSAVTRLFNSVITALGYTGRGGREAHSMNFVTLLSSPSIYIQAIRACADTQFTASSSWAVLSAPAPRPAPRLGPQSRLAGA